jgi:hypothetical protein
MTWPEALESAALADDPHLWRYRQLCADQWPGITQCQRDAYRAQVIELAGGWPDPDFAALREAAEAQPVEHRTAGCCS